MEQFSTIGFVGIGVMGTPMCANLVRAGSARVLAYDIAPAAMERARKAGAEPTAGLAELVDASDLILMSLPGSVEVEEVCIGSGGILEQGRQGLVVADLSTTSVATAREVGTALEGAGIRFTDAPVTRTAEAAVSGTLSFMVGGERGLFDALVPVFRHMGTDFSYCGTLGCGQVVKLLNNMVCAQTVVALAEALTMGRRAGVDGKVLFDALANGSANSFALHNHGMKSLLPGSYPENKYSCLYALKDLGYALEMAEETGTDAAGARLAQSLIEAVRDLGHGAKYYPVLAKIVEGERSG